MERKKFSFWDGVRSGEDVKSYNEAVIDEMAAECLPRYQRLVTTASSDCKISTKVQVGYSVAGEQIKWVDAKLQLDGTWRE